MEAMSSQPPCAMPGILSAQNRFCVEEPPYLPISTPACFESGSDTLPVTYVPMLLTPLVPPPARMGSPRQRHVEALCTITPLRRGDAAPRALATAHFAAAAAAVAAARWGADVRQRGNARLSRLIEPILESPDRPSYYSVTLHGPTDATGGLRPLGVTLDNRLCRLDGDAIAAQPGSRGRAGTYALLEKAFCQLRDDGVPGFVSLDLAAPDSPQYCASIMRALSALTGMPTHCNRVEYLAGWEVLLRPGQARAHLITFDGPTEGLAADMEVQMTNGQIEPAPLTLMPHLPYAIAAFDRGQVLIMDPLRTGAAWYDQQDITESTRPPDIARFCEPAAPLGFWVPVGFLQQHGAWFFDSAMGSEAALQEAVVAHTIEATQTLVHRSKRLHSHFEMVAELLAKLRLHQEGPAVQLLEGDVARYQWWRDPIAGRFGAPGFSNGRASLVACLYGVANQLFGAPQASQSSRV